MRRPAFRKLLLVIGLDALVCLACVNYFRRAFDLSGWLLAIHLPLLLAVLAVSLVPGVVLGAIPGLRRRRIMPYLAALGPGLAVAGLLLLYLADFASNLWMGANITRTLVELWVTDWWSGGHILPVSAWVLIVPAVVVLASVALHLAVAPAIAGGLQFQLPREGRRRALAAAGVLIIAGAYGVLFAQLSWRTPRSALLTSDPILALMRTRIEVLDERQLAIAARVRRDDPVCRAGYPRGRPFERKNVIVIIVDSLRADHMQVYGYQRPTTPYLAGLLKSGQLKKVEFATSTCAESNCGILSTMFSKTLRHQVPEAFKLYDLLADQGYATNFILSGNHDWQGLREMYGNGQTLYFDGRDSTLYGRSDDRVLFEGLERVPAAGPPAFFFFHLMSVHLLGDKLDQYRVYQPSAVKSDWNALFRGEYDRDTVTNNYDNGVLQADATIKELFARLEHKGYLQNSVVAILADHGEALGERGATNYGHITSLFQEFIRIPMLIYDPSPAPYANLQFATQIDVAPTLVDRLGLPVPACWEGASLLAPAVSERSFHQTALTAPCFAVIDRSRDRLLKYLACSVGRYEELYDLAADPGERHNLAATADPALLARLRDQLERWRGQ